MNHPPALLRSLAEKVGTPFWLYDARVIRQRIADIQFLTDTDGRAGALRDEGVPGDEGAARDEGSGDLDRRGLGQ